MPTNKNQHFVPQFYLRRFSGDQKSVGVLLIKNGRTIDTASISNQCSKPWFYGKEEIGIDGLFTALESVCSGIIERITERGTEALTHTQFEMFLMFLVMQRYRTEGARRLGLEQHIESVKRIRRDLPAAVRTEIDDISPLDQVSMSTMAVRLYPYIYDLGITVLKAPDGCEFVTSDEPVFFFNKAGEQGRVPHSIGLSSSGLLVAYPLDAKTTLLLYDRGIYSIQDAPRDQILLNPTEVHRINRLQCLSASDAVYFRDINAVDIQRLKLEIAERTSERIKFSEFTLAENSSGTIERYKTWNEGDPFDYRKQRLISFQFVPPRTNFSARFLRYRLRPQFDDTKSPGGFFRSLEFYRICKDYTTQLRAHKLRPLEFYKMLPE